MYITTPESIKQFSKIALKNATTQKQKVLPDYIASIILNYSVKTTMASLGRTVFDSLKFKTTTSQFFRGKCFYSGKILCDAIEAISKEFVALCTTGTVILILDGCCFKRGSNTRIENATQYRNKKSKSKGRSTKSHMMLLGLIILPNGMRLPAPRYTFYNKDYCKKHNIPFKTQHEIAIEMIKKVRTMFLFTTDFIILADGFFDSRAVFEACSEIKATFITPADSARVYSKNDKKGKLHDRAKNKKRNSKTFRIIKGQEKYVKEHIRFSGFDSRAKKQDTYRASSEILDVSGLGDTKVLFSWKMKTRKIKHGKSSFKVLLCNNLDLCDRKILELYALRWQVEIFFRELKSDLGAADFSGQYFDAFERFLDMILLSYLYLEWNRNRIIQKEKSPKTKGKLRKLRTRGLINITREEAFDDAIDYYKEKAV